MEGFRFTRFTHKQVQQHTTYRGFLGISTEEKVLNHSMILKFPSQRLQNEVFWEKVFIIVFFSFTVKDSAQTKYWAAGHG